MSLRDGPLQDLKVPLTWTAAVAVIVAIVIGIALVLGDRRETFQGHAITATRGALDQVTRPVSGILAAPVRWIDDGVDNFKGYFFAVSENRRLRQEVADLRHWRDEAISLKYDTGRYQAILGLKTDPPIPMVGARVIADSHSPFADTRLADAGEEAGIQVGNPVMNEHGLIGRILGVAKGVSRILLLTDVSSRTPVLDDRSDSRAILTGDGSGQPKLDYLRGPDPVKVGDRILTSGDGGLFPRGLPVGVVVQGLDGNFRVRLDSDDGPIDIVRILLFRDFSQLAEQRALQATVVPPLAPADAAAVSAAANAPPPPAASSQPAAPATAAVSSAPPKPPKPPKPLKLAPVPPVVPLVTPAAKVPPPAASGAPP